MAKTSLTPFEQKRKSLLADMTPACRTVAKEFEEKIKIGNQGVILIRYDIGAKVCRVVEKEAQYGSNAVKQLAAYLGFKDDGSALYSLKNFATAFTRSFVKGQVSKPLLNGRAMELGHFLQIMKVKSKKQQHVLFDKVRAECLTCNELEKEIQANYQTKNKRTSGRKPQKPKSPGAGLQKLFSQAKQLANYADITDESIFNPLLKIAATDVNDQLVERFVDAKKEVSRAQGELAGVLRQMERVEARFKKIAQGRKASAGGKKKATPKKKATAKKKATPKKKATAKKKAKTKKKRPRPSAV